MDITALTISRHVSSDYGALRCIGCYQNAINFLTKDQSLFTLHRDGYGLSPMGWLIKDGDFNCILRHINDDERILFYGNTIETETFTLFAPPLQYDLYLPTQGIIDFAALTQVIAHHPFSIQTGLFADLRQIIKSPLSGELLQLQCVFSSWLQGDCVDWRPFLGKGLGLTPSNDDTLVGMLLVAYLEKQVDMAQLAPFFSANTDLNLLTTLVSKHYLQYAAKGIFSLTLHQIAESLLAPHLLPKAINSLLNFGHFSGADTLLGVWLGSKTVDGAKKN